MLLGRSKALTERAVFESTENSQGVEHWQGVIFLRAIVQEIVVFRAAFEIFFIIFITIIIPGLVVDEPRVGLRLPTQVPVCASIIVLGGRAGRIFRVAVGL